MSGERTLPYWTIGLYVVLIVGSGAALAVGLNRAHEAMSMTAGLALAMSLCTLPIGVRLAARGAGQGPPSSEVNALVGAVRHLADEQSLSDDARRVLNRRRERDLLRKAIEEDIAVEDWDAAMVLVKELAERFGYRSDAEEFRTRIETARYQMVERRVDEGIRALDNLIVQLRWTEANAEAARLSRLYPDSPRVEGLRHRVETARQRYKAELERRFLTASESGDVEEALELLKELDNYLTESEAEPYREVARGVIGRARENLGVQFKLAVQDRQWATAAIVGDRIIREFPNTRMAAEIREMIDGIRQRAAMGVSA
ncbi:MAG: hypothetical protein KJZ65_03100 [Phycisphaerales bacterium]|nr:hypothetical protein [Phycisphaerales bacterium]